MVDFDLFRPELAPKPLTRGRRLHGRNHTVTAADGVQPEDTYLPIWGSGRRRPEDTYLPKPPGAKHTYPPRVEEAGQRPERKPEKLTTLRPTSPNVVSAHVG